MSTKKLVKNADIVFDETKIILKSVYDKSNIVYTIQPCPDKRTGRFPECVKRVDANGDMILTEEEKNKEARGEIHYIPTTHYFKITHGKTFDLNNVWDKCEWEAIKNSILIAPSRDARDKDGKLIIDGSQTRSVNNPGRSGIAELYIYHPGLDTQHKVTRKQLIHKACSFIYNDERGYQGQINMARLLGRNMINQPLADVTDYLVTVAEKDPQKIIDLYTGGDTSLRLLFIEAKEKKVIYIKNRLYLYGDNIVLGATDDAVLAWMKEPRNIKVLDLIKKDTYPDYFEDTTKET